jgi:DNA-binding NarL/FixJ family response regulator
MKVLVIDDHALVRDALRGVLKESLDEPDVVEASDWHQASQQLAQTPDFELILLDLGLPDRDGFEILAELRERYPVVSIVVLSGRDDRESVARALDLGALGFIPKSAAREVMLSALKLVLSGGMYVPPVILGYHDAAPLMRSAADPNSSGRPATSTDLGLTDRQLDVLALLMQGKSNKAICRLLDLAEPTVKNHVSAILRALNASNRTEAVIAARALGVDPQRGIR